MSYVTQDTIWPTSVELAPGAKAVIDLFYKLADDTSSDAGQRMAKDVFTPTARLNSPAGIIQGSEEISHSRDNVWAQISKRRHAVVKVFANDKSGQDLVALGKVKMDLRNGKVVKSDWVANIILQGDKIDSMQIYADRLDLVNALKD